MDKFKYKMKMGLVGIAVIMVTGIIISLLKDKKIVNTENWDAPETAQIQNSPAALQAAPVGSAALPSSGTTTRSREEVLKHGSEPSSQYGRAIDKQEMERFKEITAKNTKRIYAQMCKDEIDSLKRSIENDEKLLKEIEASGSNAKDYEYIQSNLEKRKKRLQDLSKNE